MVRRTVFVIDGQEFYGAEAAAKYKGCSIPAIYQARRRGTINSIGIRGARTWRVKSAGRLYENANECALANNVSVSTVYKALAQSREDFIGERSNPNYNAETAEYFIKNPDKVKEQAK